MTVPAAPVSGGRPGVVGREAEQARIDAFLEALPGGARALVITGEPGIGKTALWRHGLGRCRATGALLLVAHPAEEEMPLALGALSDLVGAVELDASVLQVEASPLARGRAMLADLRRLAANTPVVVAIDDAQWLDPASAQTLRFALRRLDPEAVGLLATVRGDSDGAGTLARLLPPDRHDVVELGPLGMGALRHVLSGTVSAISRPALRRIHELSGGNPLYAIELARSLSARTVERPAVGLPLPYSLNGAIGRRLDKVPDELVPLLETVSALGRSSLGELRELLVESDLERLLGRAQTDELLKVDESFEVRFVHPLFGSAVYGRMSAPARRSLHGRLAARAVDPDVRARHVALSTDQPDAAAARLLEEAADRAAGRGAFDLAAELTRHSLRLTPPEGDEAALRRALVEIECWAAAGEATRALELADRLVDGLPSGPARAEALIQRAHLQDDDLEKGEALLLRALEDAGEDEPLRGRVLDLLGWLRGMFRGDLCGGIDCARAAVEIGEHVPDPGFRMLALAGLGHMETLAGRPTDASKRAVELEREIGQPPLWMGPRRLLAKELVWAGDLAGARALFEAAHADSMRSASERHRPYILYDRALLAAAGGDFAAAEGAVRDGVEAARDGGNAHVEAWFLYARADVDAWLGRAAEARAAARSLLQWSTSRGDRLDVVRSHHLLGLLALSQGDGATAARELAQAADLLEEIGVGHPGAFPVLPDAVEALSLSGHLDRAEALLVRLERQAAAVSSAWALAAAERSRGLLLLARGDADAAVVALEGAATAFDGLGFGPDAARAVLARGRALLRAGRRSRAADVLADARKRFSAMGASLWEARSAEELERASPGRGAGTLTPTERRIAVLVAAGRKNREIAQELYVSVATVEAHLTRTYRKLGIRSRSELARLVAEGRVEPPAQRVGKTR